MFRRGAHLSVPLFPFSYILYFIITSTRFYNPVPHTLDSIAVIKVSKDEMNSSLASLNNANVVDNNSIQSQFAQLTRERDELRYGCSTAERELHRENEQVNQIRQKQTRLADEIRVAHAAVGEVSKKRKMVLDDIKHLKVNIECDKAKTLEITVRIDHLEAEETNR